MVTWFARNYVRIDFPFIVPGATVQSTSALEARDAHRGDFTKNPHLAAFPDLIWNDRIPKIYSPQTVWSFSYQSALERIDAKFCVNYDALYRSLSLIDKVSLLELISCSHQNKRGFVKLTMDLFTVTTRYALSRLRAKLGRLGVSRLIYRKRLKIVSGLLNSISASDYIDALLVESEIRDPIIHR